MDPYFKTEDMAVGYDGHILIHDINILLEKGKILTWKPFPGRCSSADRAYSSGSPGSWQSRWLWCSLTASARS